MNNLHEREELSYTELLGELQTLAREGRTGMMFILTESNHSVRIGLNMGRVVSCTYRVHTGQMAIAPFRRILSGKYSFTQGASVVVSGADLPSNVDFFRELAAISDQDVLSAPAPGQGPGLSAVKASASAQVAYQQSPPGSTDLRVSGGELFETVVHELASYMGPVARIVAGAYEDELCSAITAEQVRAIVFRLAQGIDDTRQASEFEVRVKGLVA